MQLTDHALLGTASKLPINKAVPVVSFSPVVLPRPDGQPDLQLRVSFPFSPSQATDGALPIILLSHGHGLSNYLSSLEGYAPIADFWAGHGFVVVQPTHLSSKSLGIALEGSNIRDIFLESRARDMSLVLDNLDAIGAAVPLLQGKLDSTRVAVAGHSLSVLTAERTRSLAAASLTMLTTQSW
jgi:predicted dienelactone hydrolase